MITFRHKGDFSKATNYLGRVKRAVNPAILDKYGAEGVKALASETPIETGLTASSWYYKIVRANDLIKLEFFNSNIQNGVPIAIVLFYGHGTRNGGWVEGRDYINPAIQPIFDKLSKELWREVTRL